MAYSDPWAGHTGTIYRAAGLIYIGESMAMPMYRLPVGNLHHSRTLNRHSLSTSCGCGQLHGDQYFASAPFPTAYPVLEPLSISEPALEGTPVPIEARHVVYSAALGLLDLREEALDDLIGRGLSMEAIELAGCRSIPHRGRDRRTFMAELVESVGEELIRQCPVFTDKNGRLTFWTASDARDGYVVPYRNECGFITGFQQKVLEGNYLTARGSILSSVYHLAGMGGHGRDLYVTEGAIKVNVASHLGGIWTFAVAGQSLTLQHVDVIKSLRPGRVIVALDQEDNANADRARERWARTLWEQGLPVFTGVWEGEQMGGAKRLDDLMLYGHSPRVRRICEVPSEMGRARRPETTTSPGPVYAGRSLEKARQLTRRSVRDFLGHPQRNQGKSILISPSPGSGKTTAVAQALRELGRTASVLVGTKNLAVGLAYEHGYTLIEGRNQENCERFDVVEALCDAGHKIGKLACGTPSDPRCPERGVAPTGNNTSPLERGWPPPNCCSIPYSSNPARCWWWTTPTCHGPWRNGLIWTLTPLSEPRSS